MKVIYVLLLLLTVLTNCNECPQEQQFQTSVYMFIDYTDSLNYSKLKENRSKDSAQIAALFSKSACNSGEFRIVSINNIGSDIDDPISYDIIPEGVTEFTMPDDVLDFFRKIQPHIKKYTRSASSQLNNTKIFEPLCQKIKQLQQAPKGRKILLIYSDMLENSDVFTMYNRFNLENTDSILKVMETKCKCKFPESMKDVEINIVNHRDPISDTLIRNACRFWEKVFNGRKVKKMHIGPSMELNG